MSILEAYRALIAAGWQPERAVEFHWYAAEVRVTLNVILYARAMICLGSNRKAGSLDRKLLRGRTKFAMSTLWACTRFVSAQCNFCY